MLRSVFEDLQALNGGVPSDSVTPTGDGIGSRLLAVAEAAEKLQVSPKWMYRHDDIPFLRRSARRCGLTPRRSTAGWPDAGETSYETAAALALRPGERYPGVRGAVGPGGRCISPRHLEQGGDHDP